jgi:2-polyprenyl-6-methoxyphenol hydroxylase-like FAD-dependent oxidoreductase
MSSPEIALKQSTSLSADVIVVGAGLTGALAATLLAWQGVRVILVDRSVEYPPRFKAEKLEPDQIEMLRRFGQMERLLPRTGHIQNIWEAQDGRVIHVRKREQYGIFYQDIVNGIRAALPPEVKFRLGTVQQIGCSGDVRGVTLEDGEEYFARLVVLATGTESPLLSRLGMMKRPIPQVPSDALGFTIEPASGGSFPFDAATYYPEGCGEKVAYLSLFRIGTAMRANLFAFWSGNETGTRGFLRSPHGELDRLLPKLERVTGKFEVVSRVEAWRTQLYRMEGHLQPGLVLLADAFQNVCPTTGLGVSKVLTDVDVFCNECVPRWLSTPGMDVEKIASFYQTPRKRHVDELSLMDALRNRQLALDRSLAWQARRARRRWTSLVTHPMEYFTSLRRLRA